MEIALIAVGAYATLTVVCLALLMLLSRRDEHRAARLARAPSTGRMVRPLRHRGA